MTSTSHLEPFDFSNLPADKPCMPANRHAVAAREIIAGRQAAPDAPDVAKLPDLYNAAVLAVRGAEGAASDLAAASAESEAAAAALEAVLGSCHEGLSDKEAVTLMRSARDRDDMAGLHVRRARSVLDQVTGHRRKALAELGAAVESAAMAAATRAAVDAVTELEARVEPGCRARFSAEVGQAVDLLALTSGKVAAIGGRAELLHGRARDLRVENPSAPAIAYFLRICRELIELLVPPAPAAELPPDPILAGIVDSKPRRRRAA